MPKERERKRKAKMKNKLALIISLISVAVALAVIGVGVFIFFSNDEGSYPEFLTSHDWESCDSEISCTESINFREDGGFSYHCGCGSPVEDYDLFDSYTYDSKNNVINVKGLGTRKIKVLYYDETMLFLKLPDGAFKYFINEDAISIDEEFDFVRDMLEEAQLYVNIREGDGEHITIVPQHYSADELERYEGLEFCAPVAKDAKIHTLYAKIENGKESYEYEEISFEGAFETADNSMTGAYVDFNEKGEITTVIIYGATEIWG